MGISRPLPEVKGQQYVDEMGGGGSFVTEVKGPDIQFQTEEFFICSFSPGLQLQLQDCDCSCRTAAAGQRLQLHRSCIRPGWTRPSVVCWCLLRLIYWLCLALDSSIRGLGFAFSFLPTVVMMGANLYYMCSSVGQDAIFDVAVPTTPPPPRLRWWF